jgi:hypothetical protein
MTAIAKRENDGAAVSIPSGERGSITQLLHLAVERGTPVEQLQQLVALHERMEEREARQEFVNAMAAFQFECPSIKRAKTAHITTGKGSNYSYTYSELDYIAKIVNPILAKHGLRYTWDTDVTSDGRMLTCICTVQHVRGHSEASKFTLPIQNASAMSAQQMVGAAMTFAQRRSLSAALGITTTDDDSAEADPTPVSEQQLHTIEDMIEAVEWPEKTVVRFIKYIKFVRLADLPAARYEEALTALRTAKQKRDAQ